MDWQCEADGSLIITKLGSSLAATAALTSSSASLRPKDPKNCSISLPIAARETRRELSQHVFIMI